MIPTKYILFSMLIFMSIFEFIIIKTYPAYKLNDFHTLTNIFLGIGWFIVCIYCFLNFVDLIKKTWKKMNK